MRKLSKEEKSLLLYFETRAVDYGGKVNTEHMNHEDMILAKNMNKSKFVEFGRVVLRNHSYEGMCWCKLSPKAWQLAHLERRNKAERMWEARNWIITEENCEVNGNSHFSGMNSQDN